MSQFIFLLLNGWMCLRVHSSAINVPAKMMCCN
uniref:Uncharacterized protein n=1 Tax=Aegilops tauschii subsp. strangulata TaxID=200361 RepID=A0A452YHC4_AEGTS